MLCKRNVCLKIAILSPTRLIWNFQKLMSWIMWRYFKNVGGMQTQYTVVKIAIFQRIPLLNCKFQSIVNWIMWWRFKRFGTMQTLFLFVKIANFGRITPPINLQIFKKTGQLKNVTMLQKFCYHANVVSCENCHFRSARTLSLFAAAQNSLCTSKSDLSCAEFFV